MEENSESERVSKIRSIMAGFFSQFLHPYQWCLSDLSLLIGSYLYNLYPTISQSNDLILKEQNQLLNLEAIYSIAQWIGSILGQP